MKTTAVRLYGKNDLRLETFSLPPIRDNEILMRIVSDSICMSSYKAAVQGADHKRVPDDISENPIIIGHEFCGIIEQVGSKWSAKYHVGMKAAIQPALKYQGSYGAPGYSYPYIGGNATYVVLPDEVMESDCLLPFGGDAFFSGSLAEPVSCIIGAFRANYHNQTGDYIHTMGIKHDGRCAILGGCGPMGLGAIDYALHGPMKPSLLVITDIDDARLARTASIFSEADAMSEGVKLVYFNTSQSPDAAAALRAITSGQGFDDVFVFVPIESVAETGSRILGFDGCLNIFAGATNKDFAASINLYEIHYSYQHLVGTSGGNTDDMRQALSLMESNRIQPASMITHIGGLDSAAQTTLNLPHIPGGKKLIYTHISLPLTDLSALEEAAQRAAPEKAALYLGLHEIISAHNGLWNAEAEAFLLQNADSIEIR